MIARTLGRVLEQRFLQVGLSDPSEEFTEALGGRPTNSGVRVNERTALGLPAVHACVAVIAEDMGKLPLHVYERQGERQRARRNDHPFARLLLLEPNPEQTAMMFWEAVHAFLKLWNRAYAYIERDPRYPGGVRALWPMAPDRTHPARDVETGELLGYRTQLPSGEPIDLLPGDVLDFRAQAYTDRTPIQLHREQLGLAVAADEYAARYFRNDASAGGLIEVPADAPEGAADRIEQRWRARHEGLSRKFTIGMLEGGAKWRDVGAPPRDAQFVEMRKLGVIEACRIFRVPPHKVADLDRATFSNIEEQSIEYVVDTLGGPAERVEQEVHRKLFGTAAFGLRGELYPEYLFAQLLRGDIGRRYAAYAIGRQWGWLSADDIRDFENMSALPEGQGETYLQPLNMVPAGRPGEQPPDAARGEVLDPERRELELLEPLVRLLSRSVAPGGGEVVMPEPYPAPSAARNGNGRALGAGV